MCYNRLIERIFDPVTKSYVDMALRDGDEMRSLLSRIAIPT